MDRINKKIVTDDPEKQKYMSINCINANKPKDVTSKKFNIENWSYTHVYNEPMKNKMIFK